MDLCERLSYLFGTEEHVEMRRQLVFLRENLTNYGHSDKRLSFICSGSLGEGVAYPKSDDDLMISDISCHVVKSCRETTRTNELLLVPTESSPGYVLLLDVKQSFREDLIQNINGMPFLSSSLWRQLDVGEDESIHGPCRTRILGSYEYDYVTCISCSFWPDQGNNWIRRTHSRPWPSFESVQNIVLNGCHVVPLGNQTSPLFQHEWRISFSLAERTLMHSFNHVQYLTYNLLRLCLKRVIEEYHPGVLCSYFIKTTLFYISENTSTEFWQESNIESCFKACLSVLYDYIDHRYCPNYFIPEYNMISRRVNYANRQSLLDTIRSLHTFGVARTVHLCGESTCLSERLSFQSLEMYQDVQIMHSINYKMILEYLYYTFLISSHEMEESRTDLMCTLLCLLQCNLNWKMSNIIFRRGIICLSQKYMNSLCSRMRRNTNTYRIHRTIKSLLRIGYKTDVTTGKLTVASYMYIIGKTSSALSQLRRLLSEYPPYTIDCVRNDIKISTYMGVMCCRGYAIDYKVQYAHAPFYILYKGMPNIFPMPLRMWIYKCTKVIIALDPLSYTYVLESMCHLRLNDKKSLMKSTRCLVNQLEDLIDETSITYTRMCVGIIKYAQVDRQSACRWLGSAYIRQYSTSPSCPRPDEDFTLSGDRALLLFALQSYVALRVTL